MGDSSETPAIPPRPDDPAVSRKAVAVLRLLVLLLAAGAVAIAVAVSVREAPASSGSSAAAGYVCPMHQEVRSKQPGPCPICGMDLEPVNRSTTSGAGRHGEMPGMTDMTAVENIRKHKIIDFVRTRSLLVDLRELRGAAVVDDDGAIAGVFYDDQVAAIAVGEPGTFTLAAAPATTCSVRRLDGPPSRWDRSTSRIRFQTTACAAKPGQTGWIELRRKPREVLSVPATAVLQSPEGPYVLVPGGGIGFDKRPIEIGETFVKQGFVVVLAGLHAHDRVVSRATFFIDGDRRTGSAGAETNWAAP